MRQTYEVLNRYQIRSVLLYILTAVRLVTLIQLTQTTAKMLHVRLAVILYDTILLRNL
jgi:hypothetical protein